MEGTWWRWTVALRCWWTTLTMARHSPRRARADMLDLMLDPLSLGFMQRALLAGLLVGIVTAAIGVFVVLRGLGFLGDAVSHAAFPGVVIAFLLGAQVALGALVAAVGTAALIAWVSQRGAL